jgi:hypothetical protein
MIGNIHYCNIEYEDSDTEKPLRGSFDVLYAGPPPARISLVVSTAFPTHVSASFVTDEVTARFGLLIMVVSAAVLSLGIGFGASLLRLIRIIRHRNDQTLVLVRVNPDQPKPTLKSNHAGIRRLKNLSS